jgi:hypothetical protein
MRDLKRNVLALLLKLIGKETSLADLEPDKDPPWFVAQETRKKKQRLSLPIAGHNAESSRAQSATLIVDSIHCQPSTLVVEY